MGDELNDSIKGIAEGCFEALEEVCRKYHGFVVALLRRFNVPDGDLDDVAQETFMRFYAQVRGADAQFTSKKAVRVYLYRCAYSSAMDYHRLKKKEKGGVPVDDPGGAGLTQDIPSGDDPERRAALYEALDGLAPADREVIILKEVYGLSHEEIAERRGVGVGTAKNQLWQARRKFMAFFRGRGA